MVLLGLDEYRSESGHTAKDLRTRIFTRMRSPCVGRFDPTWCIEREFRLDVHELRIVYKRILNRDCDLESEKNTVIGLMIELDDVESFVHDAWRRQDRALEAARNNPRTADLPPSQTTLF